jgi:hypothetical protein
MQHQFQTLTWDVFAPPNPYYDANDMYPTKQVVPEGKPEARTTNFINDFNSGLLTNTTDSDNSSTTYGFSSVQGPSGPPRESYRRSYCLFL